MGIASGRLKPPIVGAKGSLLARVSFLALGESGNREASALQRFLVTSSAGVASRARTRPLPRRIRRNNLRVVWIPVEK